MDGVRTEGQRSVCFHSSSICHTWLVRFPFFSSDVRCLVYSHCFGINKLPFSLQFCLRIYSLARFIRSIMHMFALIASCKVSMRNFTRRQSYFCYFLFHMASSI